MKKETTNIVLSIFVAFAMIGTAAAVEAQNVSNTGGVVAAERNYTKAVADLKYPIAELGGCTDQAKCASYCENPSNMDACLSFAEKSQILDPKDIELGKKVAKKISEGKMPGGCKTKNECEAFCVGKVENIQQCVALGEELGMIPPEELKQAKQVIDALSKGATMPGGCKSKGECENYCSADGHFTECIGFAEKAGFVNKEEAEMARKVGGKGPGACKSKDSCEKYCEIDSHADECLNFAIDKGLVSESQLTEMKQGLDKMKQGLEAIPADARPQVEACLKNAIGAEKYSAVMSGKASLGKDSGTKIPACFTETMKNYGEQMKEKAMNAAKQGGAGGGIPTGGAGIPQGIPAGAGGPSSEEINKAQQQFKDRGAPPTQEEINQIQTQMMQKYAPQGMPAGGPPAGF